MGTYVLRQGGSGYELGKNNTGNASVLFGSGNSTAADRFSTSVANARFMNFHLQNSATSGDNRGMYLRLYMTGAGGGGEALRVFTTVENVAAGTAHGAHISLNFADTGTVTGQGIAGRNTLHLPNAALTSNVSMAAVQAEIYSDGANSDPGGSTLLSYFRAVNDGHANGKADVDDDAVLIEVVGTTAGAAKMFATGLTAATVNAATTCSLKIRVAGTVYYLPVATAIS